MQRPNHLGKIGSGYSYRTRTPICICYSYGSLLRMIITGSNPSLNDIAMQLLKANRFKIKLGAWT